MQVTVCSAGADTKMTLTADRPEHYVVMPAVIHLCYAAEQA